MKKFYVILALTPPQGLTEYGFEIEAADLAHCMKIIRLIGYAVEWLGEPDIVEITTKKRRGVEYRA